MAASIEFDLQYRDGYVAFIDILGFSTYVEDENNARKTNDLFSFVKNFCILFNDSPSLDTQVSFFSDSIVLSAKELTSLIVPISLAESYLDDNLGLLFRGGIVFGKYYHKDGVTFGPAVVNAYRLENKANYSRIILDQNITISEKLDFRFFRDYDGYYCLNPYSTLLNRIQSFGSDGVHYPEGDLLDAIKTITLSQRNRILEQIKKNVHSPVVEKSVWRIRPFNNLCKILADLPVGYNLYKGNDYRVNEKFKTFFREQVIAEQDLQI